MRGSWPCGLAVPTISPLGNLLFLFNTQEDIYIVFIKVLRGVWPNPSAPSVFTGVCTWRFMGSQYLTYNYTHEPPSIHSWACPA